MKMRMWEVEPRVLCRNHLLGEHYEMHMFTGTLAKGKSVAGYVRTGLVIVNKIEERHNDLAVEMESRGYRHSWDKPLRGYELSEETLTKYRLSQSFNHEKSLQELLSRCPVCRGRWELG